MKRKDLYDLLIGIRNCDNLSNPEAIEFVFRICDLGEKIEKEIAKYEKQRPKATEEYITYVKKDQNLLDEYAQKDNNGKIITTSTGIAISNVIRFNEEREKLTSEFKDIIEANKKLNESFDNFLEQDCDIVLVAIPKKFIPKTITITQLKGIWNIVEH